MDILTQKKVLVRIVILLAVLNLSLIGIFIWKEIIRKSPLPPRLNEKRDEDKKRDVSTILEKELSLTEKQAEQIKKLRSDYFEKEKLVEAEIRNERDSMNAVMFSKTTNDEIIKSLARRIADNEYKMELLRFEQAQEFKSICTPEQMEKFEKLVKEIRDYFKPDNKPKEK